MKSVLTFSLIASLASAWNIEIFSTQNSCGGEGAPDTSTGGPAKKTTGCRSLNWDGVQALNITDWDSGCKVLAYSDLICGKGTKVAEFIKKDVDVVNNNWACINYLLDKDIHAINYKCD